MTEETGIWQINLEKEGMTYKTEVKEVQNVERRRAILVGERDLYLPNFAMCYIPFLPLFLAFPPSLVFLCPLQGFIPLQGNQVSELAPNLDEPGKHLFEIAPGRPAFPSPSYLTLGCPSAHISNGNRLARLASVLGNLIWYVHYPSIYVYLGLTRK